MASNLNVVALTGNLTRDPELRSLASGTSVCSLRIANNQRAKVDGEWTEKPHYFDVTVWGAQGESVARYMSKGRPIAVQGRLEWREWQAEDGSNRQAVQIVAESVQFLGGRDDSPATSTASEGDSSPTEATGDGGAAPDASKIPF